MSLLFSYEISAKNFYTYEKNGRRETIPESFTFQGDNQSMSNKEIVSVTEGRLSSGMIIVMSNDQLNVSQEGNRSSSKGTYVLYEGNWYEVVSEMSSNTKIPELTEINHYEYLAEFREREVS